MSSETPKAHHLDSRIKAYSSCDLWSVQFLTVVIQLLHVPPNSHLSSHPHRAPFEVIGAPRAEHFVGVQSKVRVSDTS